MSPLDKLRQVIQEILDTDEDAEGWTLGPFVIAMGIERIDADGEVLATSWYWAPRNQADWMTAGLLESAIEMRSGADIVDD